MIQAVDEVELERRAEHLERQVGQIGAGLLAGQRAAGDGDHVADRQAAPGRVGERAGDGFRVGEVERVGDDVVALRPHAVDRDDAVAARDERLHESAAEAACRARDEDVGHRAGGCGAGGMPSDCCASMKRW